TPAAAGPFAPDIDLSRPASFPAAWKPLLATRRDEAQRFDTLFDAHWLRRGVKRGGQPAPTGRGTEAAKRRPTLGPVPQGVSALADATSRAAADTAHAVESQSLQRGGA